MGSKYFTSLKTVNFDEVEAKIQEASLIYKGIEQLCEDLNPLRKKVKDYGSVVSAFLSLKKTASMCHHLDNVEKVKACALSRSILRDHILPWFVQILMHQ